MRRPSKRERERERERERGGGSKRTTPDLNRHRERVARVAVASPLPTREDGRIPGVWRDGNVADEKIGRRAASINRLDRSFIEIKVSFFFFFRKILVAKVVSLRREREREERLADRNGKVKDGKRSLSFMALLG